jgi:hypothetical protein
MPIEFFDSPEGRRVGQSFDSPTVYLDHWAIRLFSDAPALQDRLVSALVTKRETLLISTVSMAELGSASDPRHIFDAEAFLERCLPHLFLTDFRLDKLRAREMNEGTNATRFWPTADLAQLKLFGERSQAAGQEFTMRGFAQMAYEHRSPINELMRSNARKMIEAVDKARSDPDYVRKARDAPLSESRTRMMLIMGELLRGFILDPNLTMSENDAVDLVHAAIPLNCCDYVLLDGPWAERVAKMKLRLDKSAMVMPIAKCFSRRNDGITAFLTDLENFDLQSQPPAPRR